MVYNVTEYCDYANANIQNAALPAASRVINCGGKPIGTR